MSSMSSFVIWMAGEFGLGTGSNPWYFDCVLGEFGLGTGSNPWYFDGVLG